MAEQRTSDSAPLSALLDDAARECLPALKGVTGTHALLLDGMGGDPPAAPGLGRWTTLRLAGGCLLGGPLCAAPDALPFLDDSFCVVMIRHAAGRAGPLDTLVAEAARVLAPHGLLLIVEMHPWSGWRWWLGARLRRGQVVPQTLSPQCWQRALRNQGLAIGIWQRCGAPWPRARGVHGLPRWAQWFGGAYLFGARKPDRGGVVQLLSARRLRAAREHASWAPGARRVSG